MNEKVSKNRFPCWMPATLLKTNSLTDIFQGFAKFVSYFFKSLKVRNRYYEGPPISRCFKRSTVNFGESSFIYIKA